MFISDIILRDGQASAADYVSSRARLGYYVASSGNSLPSFRDNLSVPSRCVLAHKSAVLFYVSREDLNRASFLVLFGSCLTVYFAVVCLCSFRFVKGSPHRWRQNGSPLSASSGI